MEFEELTNGYIKKILTSEFEREMSGDFLHTVVNPEFSYTPPETVEINEVLELYKQLAKEIRDSQPKVKRAVVYKEGEGLYNLTTDTGICMTVGEYYLTVLGLSKDDIKAMDDPGVGIGGEVKEFPHEKSLTIGGMPPIRGFPKENKGWRLDELYNKD